LATSLVLDIDILKLNPISGILIHWTPHQGLGSLALGSGTLRGWQMDSLCQAEEGTVFRCFEKYLLCY